MERARKLHRQTGTVRKIKLFKQLLNKCITEGENAQMHVMEFSAIVDTLSEILILLQEELIVIMLLQFYQVPTKNLLLHWRRGSDQK